MSKVLQRGKTHPPRLKLSMEMVVSILLSQGLIYPFHLRFRGCTKHEPMDDHLVPSSGLGASRFSRAISTKPAQFQYSLLKQCWEAYNTTSGDCDNDLWTAQPQITVCQEPLLQNLLPNRLWKHFIFYIFTIFWPTFTWSLLSVSHNAAETHPSFWFRLLLSRPPALPVDFQQVSPAVWGEATLACQHWKGTPNLNLQWKPAQIPAKSNWSFMSKRSKHPWLSVNQNGSHWSLILGRVYLQYWSIDALSLAWFATCG